MKQLKNLVCILLISYSFITVGAQTIVINYNTTGLPDFDVKRGHILSDAIKTNYNSLLQYIDKSSALGMKLILMAKDLNQFDPKWSTNPFGSYYLSYRSQNSTLFTPNDPEEFSKGANGQINIHINKQFLNLCRKAKDDNLQIVLQCSGVPVEGYDNGTVNHLFSLDATRSFHESARYYPLPAVQAYDSVATVVANYAKNLRDSLQVSNMIYVGNQEPSHTPGYYAGKQTAQGTIDNIKQYIKVWKPLATQLKEYQIPSAALQLNSSKNDYVTGVKALYDEQVEFDFFSLQNYKSENNVSVLGEAIAQLQAYHFLQPKKILMNRYSFESSFTTDNSQQFNTSRGVCEFLDSELNLSKYAQYVYGYCYFAGVQNQPMMDSVFVFLNKAPVKQKNISGLPTGVSAMALADDKRLSVAIWNKGTATQTLSVDISSFPETFVQGALTVYKGAESLFSAYDQASLHSSEITNLSLATNEFMLLTLIPGTPSAVAKNTLASAVTIYPNPCKEKATIRHTVQPISKYELYDSVGRVLKTVNNTNEIDMRDLPTGGYLVKIYTADNVAHTYSLIKGD